MMLPWQLPPWLGTVLALGLGTCVVVGGVALGSRLTRSAVWQRTCWESAILGILVLLITEITGISSGIVQCWRVRDMAPRPALFMGSESAEGPTSAIDTPGAGKLPLAGHDSPAPAFGPTVRFQEPGRPAVGGFGEVRRPAPSVFADFGDVGNPAPSAADVGGASGPASSDGTTPELAVVVTTTPPAARTVAQAASWSQPWGVRLAFIWFLVAAVLLIRMAWARWLLQRFRRQQRRVGQAVLQQRVDQLAARLNLRRRVEVLASPGLAAPIAFGFLRPVIVVPASFTDDFDTRQQEAMLAHEVAHLAARDPLWQLLADLAAVLLWWHPLVWWTRRRWRKAGELAADEACLLVPDGADTLAACLVVVARRMSTASRPRLAWQAMAGPGLTSALSQRVERLLNLSAGSWRPPTRRRLRAMTATVPVVLLLVAVSCTAWARARAPVTEGETTMKVFVDSWRQSLAAVTLAAVLAPVSGDASRTQAAEGEHDVPLVKVEAEKPPHSAEAAKEGHEGAHREVRETPREERKPDARPEGEPGREGGDEREARAREIAQRRAQLQEQAAEIRRKLQALRPDQDADERELKGALERIERQLQELQAPAPNRDRVRARLEELKAAQRQAQEAGKADEAERLGREAHELLRMLEQGPGDRPAIRPEGEEMQRRLQHLRAAIENLRAAGLNDQANALARDAERLARGERPAAPERDRQPEPGRPVYPAAAAPQLERSVQELRGQVQELRQQMEEIRQHLKILAEKR